MKNSKKIASAFIILITILLIGGILSVPLINNYSAYQVEKMLRKTPLPEKTELIESVSRAAKLTGNGNGMQYFGAILIQSELSLKELNAYYSDYQSEEWEYLVAEQKEQSIQVIEHGTMQFKEKIKGSGYYIVYSWGSGYPLLEEIDLRGH